jgi:hypothetical protein
LGVAQGNGHVAARPAGSRRGLRLLEELRCVPSSAPAALARVARTSNVVSSGGSAALSRQQPAYRGVRTRLLLIVPSSGMLKRSQPRLIQVKAPQLHYGMLEA